MIEIKNLNFKIGKFSLKNINLKIRDGEYMVLLGPTGAGKTIFLECIVGIHRKYKGNIFINEKDVTNLYPEERNIGFVPQDCALFPHFTVEQNLSYGLRMKKKTKGEIDKRLEELFGILKLKHIRYRFPLNLSGGEKHRVALGRALAPSPDILLLDEPLSTLDENMRWELTKELKKIHEKIGGTFLHVTHNFEEASDVADRIAIIKNGEIIQVGSAKQILHNPKNRFVAEFTRARNILSGKAFEKDKGSIIELENGFKIFCSQKKFGKIEFSIRPEEIILYPNSSLEEKKNIFSGIIKMISWKPAYLELKVDIGIPLIVYLTNNLANFNIDEGEEVLVYIPEDKINLLD